MKPGVHRAIVLWAIEDAVNRLDALACRLHILIDAEKIEGRLNEFVKRGTPEPIENYSDAWWAEQGRAMREAYDRTARAGHLIQQRRERS